VVASQDSPSLPSTVTLRQACPTRQHFIKPVQHNNTSSSLPDTSTLH